MVVIQQPAQTLATLDVARVAGDFISRLDDLIAQSLVVAFFVVVSEVSGHSTTQRPLAEEDHAVEVIVGQHAPGLTGP